ncbi:hypothetical protein ABT144_25030 [Streptomyces sp. NPDC002039]|uniref:hypothetical protein n=1 Tax=unclassified Streptomyces TaxID=2593676 RepID=UPI0033340FCE
METEQCRTRRVPRPALYPLITAGCLLLSCAAGWSNMLLLVAGRVIPSWAVSAALLLVSLVLMGVAAVRRLSEDGRRRSEDGRKTGRHMALPPFLRGLAVVVAVLGSVFGVLGDVGAEYHVLHPTGPHGCRAVVRETSFLVIGNGDVYAVGRTGIAWRPAGSWWADDAYRPIARGTYELRWGPQDGTLALRGSTTDPVMEGVHRVDCG